MRYTLSPEQKPCFAEEFRQRLEGSIDLPVLPEVAHQLLALRNNSDAGVSDLVKVMAKDPAIAVQILSYTRMSYFGFGDRIKSIQDAIVLVMGYEKALALALGLSAGQSLTTPISGPLGGQTVWENAVKTAILTQALAEQIPTDRRPEVGLCYLSGLLHEIGLLLLAHLYPEKFSMLNKYVQKFQDMNLRELEFQCLGISHDVTGVHLLRVWNMPEEIIVATGEYNFADYDGKYSIYSKLVYLAKQLIKQPHENINDVQRMYSQVKFDDLGLSDEAVDTALQSIRGASNEIAEMVKGLAA